MMYFGKNLVASTVIFVLVSLCFCLSAAAQPAAPEEIIKITAKKFEYSPSTITLKKGIPVVLQLTSLDRLHGFNCPDLGIRGDIKPNETTEIRFVPDKVGVFPFACDVFCGMGHGHMNGKIVVEQ